MSLNPIPLKLYKTEDPVCKVGNEREYAVMKGAQEVFYYPFPTSGNPNSAVNTINCNPTSQRTIIDRKLYLQAQFTLSFTGTNASGAAGALLLPGYDAPRAYPLAMVTKNIQVQLGDQSVSTNLNEYFSAIERYSFDKELEDHEFSTSPTMPDQYTDYNNGLGQNNSELGYYGTNSAQVPRGYQGVTAGFVATAPWYTVTQSSVASGAGTTASVVLTVTEPIFLSPLYFGKGEHSGIIGIQNMQVQVQFGDLARLWSHNPSSNPISNVSVVCNSLNVLVKQLTPDSLAKIPSYIPYPYNQITAYPNGNFTTLASGASAPFASGSITLNSIPTRLYVYCRQQNSDLTFSSTDTFAVLNSLTIQLGTRQLLSSATPQDLYNISRRNGCNLSWAQWSKQVGSVLAIDLSKDIGLQPTESPGLLTRSSLIITANFTNTHNTSINYQMYVLVCEEGTVTIDNGHMLKSVGVLTQADILAAEHAPEIPYKNDRNIYGGAWYNDLWSGIKKGVNFVKDEIVPVAKGAYDVYKTVTGRGTTGSEGGGVVGGRKRSSKKMMMDQMMENEIEGGRRHGGGLVGARMISRSDL
jgi:hypothetical protein